MTRKPARNIVTKIRDRKEKLFLRENRLRTSDRRLDGVFERLYFHEIDSRDKNSQRLQLPLVAFIALSGALGNIAQNAQRSLDGLGIWMWGSFCIAALFLFAAFVYFVASVLGHTYSFLPVPHEWQAYREQCAELYKDEEDADKLIDAAIQQGLADRFAECATANGHINAQKAFYVFMILRFLVGGAFLTALSYGFYVFGGLGPKPTHRVEIVNQVSLKGVQNAQPKATATATAAAAGTSSTGRP